MKFKKSKDFILKKAVKSRSGSRQASSNYETPSPNRQPMFPQINSAAPPKGNFKYENENEDIAIRIRALKDDRSFLNEEYTPEGEQENSNPSNIVPRLATELPYFSNAKGMNAILRTNSQYELKRGLTHMVALNTLESMPRPSSSRGSRRASKTSKKPVL